MESISQTSQAIVLPSCVSSCAVVALGSVGWSGVEVVLWQLAVVGGLCTYDTCDGNGNAKADGTYGAPPRRRLGRLADTEWQGCAGEVWEMGGPLCLLCSQIRMPVSPTVDKVPRNAHIASLISLAGYSRL